MTNPIIYTSFFFALGIGWFISIAYRYAVKESDYDERQLLLTYKSYKYGAWVAWGWCLLFGIVRNSLNLSGYTMIQTIFFTSLATHLSFRILHHSLSRRKKSDRFLIAITLFLTLLLPLHYYFAYRIQPLGVEDCFNMIILMISFVSILVSMMISQHQDKLASKEEEDS